MTTKKTLAEALAASIKRLKLSIPADFVVDAASVEHENLQRLFACGMSSPETFDAEIGPFELRGIIVQANFVRDSTADGRTWRELARHNDAEVALGIFDESAEDPQVFYANNDEGWDDNKSVPLPGYARPLCKLSQLVTKVKRRAAEKPSKALPADLKELAWSAPMRLRSFTPIHASGPAVLGRVIEPTREGVEDSALNEGVGIYYADGRIETVAMRATHSNYLSTFGWAGDAIVTLGQRRNKLTHVGLMERTDAGWTARELWSIDPASPEAKKASDAKLVLTAEIFAYVTYAEENSRDHLVHAWRRQDKTWQFVGSLRVGDPVTLFVVGVNRLWCYHYVNNGNTLVELVIDDNGIHKGEERLAPTPNAIDQGRTIVKTMYEGLISIFERGVEVQKLKTPKKSHGHIIAQDGCLIVLAMFARQQKPCTLYGYRHDGKAYVPWFERTNVNFIDHRGEYHPPEEIALTERTLYLGFGYLGIRRLELPAGA